jgi:hypothetical protein
MPTPPTKQPPVLPMEKRPQVAELARVPKENREDFYDVIQLPLYGGCGRHLSRNA